MLSFWNYSSKSKRCNDWNKLVFDKMKGARTVAAIEEYVGLNPKIYLLFGGDNNSEYKIKGRIKLLLKE